MKGKIMQNDTRGIIWLILLLVFVYCCARIYGDHKKQNGLPIHAGRHLKKTETRRYASLRC